MWYIIICMQEKKNGINVYHPHDRNQARELALNLLYGRHKNGLAPCVYISSWNRGGKCVHSRLCSLPSHVEEWMNAEVGRCSEWVCDTEARRMYQPVTCRGKVNFGADCYAAFETHGDAITASRIFTALEYFTEELKKEGATKDGQ